MCTAGGVAGKRAGLAAAHQLHGLDQGARGVARLLLEGLVAIERVVVGGIGFVVADIAVELGGMAGRDQAQVFQPVDQEARVVPGGNPHFPGRPSQHAVRPGKLDYCQGVTRFGEQLGKTGSTDPEGDLGAMLQHLVRW